MTVLKDAPWLSAPETQAVMAALEARGGPGCARFVGGCVRNSLIGRPADDIDIATVLRPEAVVEALRAAGLKAIPTGLEHGTVTAVSRGRPHEVTTLRRDVSTDGRRATVAFTDDWAEDAARRDFRLNALYADAQGRVLDPTGQGVEDALAGRIVFVGEPAARIREDYLRILRFFRFSAWYGRGAPDPAGLAACAELAEGIERLSAERVSKELLKLLAAPDPRPATRAMAGAGVLARALPAAVGDLSLFEAMVGISDDPALRLSALLPADPEVAARTAAALRLSNALRDRLVAAAGAAPPADDPQAARVALYRLGRTAFEDRARRLQAERGEAAGAALLDLAASWMPPTMPVGGRDLARLGVPPGPATGRILKAFEAEWIAAGFPDHGHEARLSRLVEAESPDRR